MLAEGAKLGPTTMRALVTLGTLSVLAEKSVQASLEFVDEEDAAAECKAYAAACLIEITPLMNHVAKASGISLSFSPGFDLDNLKEWLPIACSG